MKGGIVVLDFGSQLTQLIARRLRELQVYSELLPYNTPLERIKDLEPSGIILSGGPQSVADSESPKRSVKELAEIAPILGICYGMQLIASELGGKTERAEIKEYGAQKIIWDDALGKLPKEQKVWMSHGDVVTKAPDGFHVAAHSLNNHPAALKSDKIWAVQFHPEVTHTENGTEILRSFVFDLCKAEANWKPADIAKELMDNVKMQVPEGDHIIVGLSGGVDSTVVATLLTKTFGKERVHCVFVDNGLLRKNEYSKVLTRYKSMGLNVRGVDASDRFMKELAGLSDPEKKRKTIGRVFIEVFDDAVKEIGQPIQWLAQGTLYPDVIESVSPRGESVTIKSHHNVGGLPEKMNMKLVEPLRELFKDEVRALGEQIGIDRASLWRHPFPGPGLAIRVMGEVNKENLDVLREADDIYISELEKNDLYGKIWQAFCVLLPVQTVGVQGDARTYDKVVAIRAVTSHDGMTADWFDFSHQFLSHVSNRITNEVNGVNRVVYDVTSKPPGTIEWE